MAAAKRGPGALGIFRDRNVFHFGARKLWIEDDALGIILAIRTLGVDGYATNLL